MGLTALPLLPGVWRRHRLLAAPGRVGTAPLRGFGLGTDPEPRLLEGLLGELPLPGLDSVLVRLHPWVGEEIPRVREFVRELRRRGITPVAALLQDRRSVTDPGYWRGFLEEAFGALRPEVATFEVGHAWNRLKWGVRSHREYATLAEAAFRAREPHPGLRLAGPAVIDFEFLCVLGALGDRRRPLPFDVASGLLYVDRRGAPENGQMGFDLTGKAAFMRAAVDATLGQAVPYWVTETNWPLPVPGEYAPTSMKEAVDEERHADYLVRYYLLALGSGLVEKVFWWQAAAGGYGLIDDLGGGWRHRPAWRSFAALASLAAGAVPEGLRAEGEARLLTLRRPGGDRVTAAWRTAGQGRRAWGGPTPSGLLDREGRAILLPADGVLALSPSPCYVLHP
jgi:hypothetical protein